MTASGAGITLIGLDADDTLWHNERHYQMTEARFVGLLADFAEGPDVSARLLEAERRNLAIYGFGIKGFTLSMIETAVEITAGKVPGAVIQEILTAGRDLLAHPVETLPGVSETLAGLASQYPLVLITKGDLFDQERKLAQSGLGELFHGIEIVSDKNRGVYERIFAQHGSGATQSVMVGNSVKSDVIPAIEAGAWGVFVPHEHSWALERAEAPIASPRFRQIAQFGQLPDIIAQISEA